LCRVGPGHCAVVGTSLVGYLAGLSDCWSIRGSRFLAEVAAAYNLLEADFVEGI